MSCVFAYYISIVNVLWKDKIQINKQGKSLTKKEAWKLGDSFRFVLYILQV